MTCDNRPKIVQFQRVDGKAPSRAEQNDNREIIRAYQREVSADQGDNRRSRKRLRACVLDKTLARRAHAVAYLFENKRKMISCSLSVLDARERCG
jgi:hypothetical protein